MPGEIDPLDGIDPEQRERIIQFLSDLRGVVQSDEDAKVVVVDDLTGEPASEEELDELRLLRARLQILGEEQG